MEEEEEEEKYENGRKRGKEDWEGMKKRRENYKRGIQIRGRTGRGGGEESEA